MFFPGCRQNFDIILKDQQGKRGGERGREASDAQFDGTVSQAMNYACAPKKQQAKLTSKGIWHSLIHSDTHSFIHTFIQCDSLALALAL